MPIKSILGRGSERLTGGGWQIISAFWGDNILGPVCVGGGGCGLGI